MSCKSLLFVPGDNPRAIEKARDLDMDVIIFDLEDAVAPDNKDKAREGVVKAIGDGGYKAKLVVRVNGLESPWTKADIKAISNVSDNLSAITFPKIEKRQNITDAESLMFLHRISGDVAMWAMIESPLAIANLDDIVKTGSRLSALVFGTNDLKNSMGLPMAAGGRIAIMFALQQVVTHARAKGLAVFDGVYNNFKDNDGFITECLEGVGLGFDGKSLIHPNQIDGANMAFTPSGAEVAKAKAIIAAFEQGLSEGKGVIQHEGVMVEALHVEQAKRTVLKAN